MDNALIIRGRIHQRTFVSDEPMPDLEAPAELIVYAPARPRRDEKGAIGSIFGLFGKAQRLRAGEEIDAQIREERSCGDE